MKTAGMDWLAMNIGDGQTWEDWKTVVDRCYQNSVVPIPWARCRTLVDLTSLMWEAEQVSFNVIANLEDELKDVLPPNKVAATFSMFDQMNIALSCPGWLYNDINYGALGRLPVLLQIFPQDAHWSFDQLEGKQDDCVEHARAKGFTWVGVTYQTYGGALPAWYSFNQGTRSYFTGDDIGAGNWEAWA